MKITTNNVPRELEALANIPEKARADFDYISEDDAYSARMFQYRGVWYDSHEFVRIQKRSDTLHPCSHTVDDDSPLLAWDGIQTDTHFSGVLIRYADRDCERVIVGSCYA